MERDGRSLPPSRPQVIESSKTSLTHTLHRFRLWCCLQTCTPTQMFPQLSAPSTSTWNQFTYHVYLTNIFAYLFTISWHHVSPDGVTIMRWYTFVSLLIHIFIIIVVRLLFPWLLFVLTMSRHGVSILWQINKITRHTKELWPCGNHALIKMIKKMEPARRKCKQYWVMQPRDKNKNQIFIPALHEFNKLCCQ